MVSRRLIRRHTPTSLTPQSPERYIAGDSRLATVFDGARPPRIFSRVDKRIDEGRTMTAKLSGLSLPPFSLQEQFSPCGSGIHRNFLEGSGTHQLV